MSSDLEDPKTAEEQPKKPPRRILRLEIEEAMVSLERPAVGLFISGLSAGLDIGFSVFVMGVTWSLFHDTLGRGALQFLVANAYAVGFLFVILGRSELFTEQTTLAVLPVLNRKASLGSLARLWALVYVSNLLGAAAFAVLAVLIGPALGAIDPQAFAVFANRLTQPTAPALFASAVLAGWLMGLLSWLVAAGRDTISQIVLIWIVATVIGLCGLSHVVVGTVEVLAGLFAGQGVTLDAFGHFLVWSTLGNIVGGAFFVAVIKYTHIIRIETGERRSSNG